MKWLPLLLFLSLGLPLAADPRADVIKIKTDYLRELHQERRESFYKALEQPDAIALEVWLEFIERGGLDDLSITLDDLRKASRGVGMTSAETDRSLVLLVDFGDLPRLREKQQPEDPTLEQLKFSKIRKHAWFLRLEFDKDSKILIHWSMKFVPRQDRVDRIFEPKDPTR